MQMIVNIYFVKMLRIIVLFLNVSGWRASFLRLIFKLRDLITQTDNILPIIQKSYKKCNNFSLFIRGALHPCTNQRLIWHLLLTCICDYVFCLCIMFNKWFNVGFRFKYCMYRVGGKNVFMLFLFTIFNVCWQNDTHIQWHSRHIHVVFTYTFVVIAVK